MSEKHMYPYQCEGDGCPLCFLEARIEALEAEKKVAFGDGQMNVQIKLAGRIAELEADNAKLRGLLGAAQCPNDCDNGIIVHDAYDHGDGDIEYNFSECQWCYAKSEALAEVDGE